MIRTEFLILNKSACNKAIQIVNDYEAFDVVEVLNASKKEPVIESLNRLKPQLVFAEINASNSWLFDVLQDAAIPNMPYVIVLSSNVDFTLRAIKISVFDYLINPVDSEGLSNTLKRFYIHYTKIDAMHQLNIISNNLMHTQVKFNTLKGYVILDAHDIIYVQADRNYSILMQKNGKPKTISMHLGKVEKLLVDKGFIRISRTHLVNARLINEIRRKERICLLKSNNINLKISRANMNSVVNYFD